MAKVTLGEVASGAVLSQIKADALTEIYIEDLARAAEFIGTDDEKRLAFFNYARALETSAKKNAELVALMEKVTRQILGS